MLYDIPRCPAARQAFCHRIFTQRMNGGNTQQIGDRVAGSREGIALVADEELHTGQRRRKNLVGSIDIVIIISPAWLMDP